MQRTVYLFLALAALGWMAFQIETAGATEEYWKPNCRVNKAAEKNVFINDAGERIYYNVDRKVLWELSNDFCVSLDLLVAYNFILVPREPVQYAYIKLPPKSRDLGWFPGKSLSRPSNYPLLAEDFLFEVTTKEHFVWPVDERLILVSQLYHQHHHGVDLDLDIGTPVSAMANGRVIRIEQDHHVYGKLIVVDHGNDLMALYAHLSDIQVRKGDLLQKRDQIGLSGNSGRSSAPHLHVEIRESFRYADPCDFLNLCPKTAFHGPRHDKITTAPSTGSAGSSPSKFDQTTTTDADNPLDTTLESSDTASSLETTDP